MDPTEKTAWITFAGMLSMALVPALATLLVAYLQYKAASRKEHPSAVEVPQEKTRNSVPSLSKAGGEGRALGRRAPPRPHPRPRLRPKS